MCNYVYVTNTKAKKTCTCAELYEKTDDSNYDNPDVTSESPLPIDESGLCIFHSENVSWKRENGFVDKFLKLTSIIDDVDSLSAYDFSEFRFVGNEFMTKNESGFYTLNLKEVTFSKEVRCNNSIFLDSIEFDKIRFEQGGSFVESVFKGEVKISNSCFVRGVDFSKTKFFQLAFFDGVEFQSYAIFDNVKFSGEKSGYTSRFQSSIFQGLTDFTHAIFASNRDQSTAGFLKVRFEDYTIFSNAEFHNQVVFDEASFSDTTEFIDTLFETSKSSARYAGAAVEFNNIEVKEKAVLNFKSTSKQSKLFKHDVQMSFRNDPEGIVEFENVNYNRFRDTTRIRLNRLEKLGKVHIGSGCVKYRFQTEARTITVSESNAPLILELCQTFTNYFTVSNGFNLGFEILERNNDEVQFFYFTDEDISEEIFFERLAKTEQDMWRLLSPDRLQPYLAIENLDDTTVSVDKRSAIVNAVDGVSALLMTFFRVGTRISLGLWEEKDTAALVNSTCFGNNETIVAHALHEVIVAKYTGKELGKISNIQNTQLQYMVNNINVTGNENTIYTNSIVQKK